MMNDEGEKKKDLRERTKAFALRIIRMYSDELTAIMVKSIKTARSKKVDNE